MNIPTELEKIMQVEAEEIIKEMYNNLEGSSKVAQLINQRKGNKVNIMSKLNIDKQIKLKQMQKTWEFTRSYPMFIRYIETFFYILISQTESVIYFCMLMSMY